MFLKETGSRYRILEVRKLRFWQYLGSSHSRLRTNQRKILYIVEITEKQVNRISDRKYKAYMTNAGHVVTVTLLISHIIATLTL